ncbi:hypothetical protein K440DRAFT_34643 [Wilcoxina mikolae CBS 423.85]|nr:hypothetical protein K440DRAFT_34643 [Wilcoxina mikolae CBS 423.85]
MLVVEWIGRSCRSVFSLKQVTETCCVVVWMLLSLSIDASIFRERDLELTLHLALSPVFCFCSFRPVPLPFPLFAVPFLPRSFPPLHHHSSSPGLSFVFEVAAPPDLLFTTGRHKYQSSPTTIHPCLL